MGIRIQKDHTVFLVSGAYGDIPFASERKAVVCRIARRGIKEIVNITGLVLTKLDGTAKGGVVIGIVHENKIPVKFIGVGEKIDDMEVFNSTDFVNAII